MRKMLAAAAAFVVLGLVSLVVLPLLLVSALSSSAAAACPVTLPVTLPAPTGQNEADTWADLRAGGFSETAAAGVMGNVQSESGFDPTIIQGGAHSLNPADAGDGGYGLVQWTPGAKLVPLLHGAPPSIPSEVAALAEQLRTTEAAAGAALRQASTPEQAADAFGLLFERYAGPPQPIRATQARAFYQQYAGSAPVTGTAAPTSPVAAVPAPPAGLNGMTLEQRVGQVFMVGAPATGVTAATSSALSERHVGSVMLTGRTNAGVPATAQVTAQLRSLADPASPALLVATDQEGDKVQVLRGPGFSAIPSALAQGALDPGVLRAQAAQWGRELHAAGVDVDLAPVMDTVPSPAAAATNPPVGAFDREYGYTPDVVASHGTAVAQGLADAGVAASIKHFPGLGRVTGNTDTTAGVTDRSTTRTDPYLAPFATALRAGAPMLMMSTAYYALLDPAHPAAFSSSVIGGMVRGDLGFHGVVISDDLANARQVTAWSPGDRAVQFLSAGGDLVLTVDPAQLPAMYDAVLRRASTDDTFRARVEQAALRVVQLKQARGLTAAGAPTAPCATTVPVGGGPLPVGGRVGQDSSGLPCANGDPGQVEAAPGGVSIRVCLVNGFTVNTLLVSNLAGLLAAAAADGITFGGSGFRSNADQVALRRAHCGPTDYDIYQRPSSQCSPPTALPGQSMHEWGLAIDFTVDGSTLTRGSPGFTWLTTHSATYGLANLPSEPWHWSTTGS